MAALCLSAGDMDPSRHKFEEVLQTCLMTMESLSVDPEVQRLGIVVVVDITRFSYKLVRWLTPYKIKVSLKFLQVSERIRHRVAGVAGRRLESIGTRTLALLCLVGRTAFHSRCRPFTASTHPVCSA